MKCLFLYNPNSGRGKVAKKTAYIRRKLEERYEVVNIVETSSAQDMEARAREGAEDYDVILFSGGDGTFNNVLQGIGERDVQLGYIPGGTVNDVARSLKIPRSVKGALKVILKGNSARLDCMRVNKTHYAMYVAAAGAFTAITYETSQKRKKLFGRIAYIFRGIRKNMKLDIFPVRCECGKDSFEGHSVFLLVMNGKSVGGMPVNRKGSMDDGVLEFALIKQKQKPNVLRRIGKYFSLIFMFLFGARIRKRDIRFLRGEHVRIQTRDDVVWDFDGEEGIRGSVDIEVLRNRVKLFVPNPKKV